MELLLLVSVVQVAPFAAHGSVATVDEQTMEGRMSDTKLPLTGADLDAIVMTATIATAGPWQERILALVAEVRRLRAERDEQTEAKEAAYQMVGRLRARPLSYLCAACGRPAHAAIDSIDSGTTLTCECGGKTVVDLDTPERRTARYAPAVAAAEERDRLRADLANMEAERDAALAAVEEARKERG